MPSERIQRRIDSLLDETYVKVAGRWCYLYRAIDRDRELIDSTLSEHRDKHAARRFLRGLVEVTERKPARITTDHHPTYSTCGASSMSTSVTTTACDRTARSRSTHRRGGHRRGGLDLAECKAGPSWAVSIMSTSGPHDILPPHGV